MKWLTGALGKVADTIAGMPGTIVTRVGILAYLACAAAGGGPMCVALGQALSGS